MLAAPAGKREADYGYFRRVINGGHATSKDELWAAQAAFAQAVRKASK